MIPELALFIGFIGGSVFGAIIALYFERGIEEEIDG